MQNKILLLATFIAEQDLDGLLRINKLDVNENITLFYAYCDNYAVPEEKRRRAPVLFLEGSVQWFTGLVECRNAPAAWASRSSKVPEGSGSQEVSQFVLPDELNRLFQVSGRILTSSA